MLDEFLKNELSFNRESGTYLFYGDDLEKNYNIALEFSAELFSKNIESEIERSKIIDKTLKNLYSDLMVVDTLNIDTVREIIKKSYTSSHEGGAKVFILKNIQDIRKESANAMLKLIEEPTKDNFFILISKRLNILSTIKSRSIIYRIRKSTPEELGVDKYVYNFFLGFSNDIEKYKEKEIDLMLEKSYKAIGGILKEYEKEKKLEVKIDLYKCLRNFVQESSSLKKYEKIKFAEDIYLNGGKENVNLIVEYLINLVKRDKNLKEKLEYKKMLRYPINVKLLLINLIMSIWGSWMSYYLYMLRCENGSIYTGIAKDYLKRYEEHLNGKGAKYTRANKVIKIERVFLCDSRSTASILENKLKKFKKNKKEDIIISPDDFIKDIEIKEKIKLKKIF